MRWSGLIKRFVPFLLTFAAGLFIASFFVSVAAPSFQFKDRGLKKNREYHRLKHENQRLRQRVERLEREKNMTISEFEVNLDVPPPPVPPMPPPPPSRVRIRD
jgi:cell division protein FtsB